MTKASDNPFPSILLEDHVDPAAPSSGFHRLFIDTDEKLKMIDHASLVTDFTPGAGGDVATDAIWAAAGDLVQGTGADTAAVLSGVAVGKVLVSGGVGTAVAWGYPQVHGAKAYNAGTQTVAAGQIAVLGLGAEEFDTDAYHDNSTNNSRFTIPAGMGGKYLVTGVVWGASGLGAKAAASSVFLRIDGTTDIRGGTNGMWTNENTQITVSAVAALTAGQYVELCAYNGTAGNIVMGHASALGLVTTVSVVLLGT